MGNILKKLQSKGIDCKTVKLSNGNDAIMCNTDYQGPYPTAAVFALQDKIRKVVKRYNVKTEPRGSYTGLLIF